MTTARIEPPSPMSPGARSRLPLVLAIMAAIAVVGLGGLALLATQQQKISLTAELPPVLVDRAPQRGEEQATGAPIVLVFDKSMDRKSTEEALSITPAVPYTVRWEDGDTQLEVIPAGEGFARDTTYEVKVATTALAANGKNLLQELLFRFKAVGYLDVTQVVPAPDTQGVAVDSDITVMFNRPVVPLTSISEQGNLPQPVTFDPPVEGAGEWLNTSIYVFHPVRPLQAGTQYTAKIAAGLSDPTGAVLRSDYAWSFTTQPPQVLFTMPGVSETNVRLDAVIYVGFNQAMDHASAQAAFSLVEASGSAVPGTFDWTSDEAQGGKSLSQETLVFTPTQLLERDTQYTINVAAGAKGVGGGSATELNYSSVFNTVPPLRIVRTTPRDGQTGVDPYSALEILFSAPVDEKTLDPNVFATPPVSQTDVYTYYSSYDNRYVYAFSAGPSSSFEVTIKGDIADPWGGTLGSDSVVHFSTHALDPEAWLNVPGRFGVYNAYTDTVVYASFRNVSQLNFDLYAMSIDAFVQLSGPDSWQLWQRAVPVSGGPIRSWSVPVEAPLNQRGLRRVPLVAPPEGETAEGTQVGGALAPGIYFLRVSSPEQPNLDYGGVSRHLLVVATTNVTFKTAEREALVWATDFQSGQPVSGVPVALKNAAFLDIGGGSTDASGVYTIQWLEQRDPFETKFAIAGTPGSLETPFGLTINDWSSGIEGYEFGVPTEYFHDPNRVYIYTEKPLYRPGQPVHFKGIVRAEDNARYAIDQSVADVWTQIYDPNGTEVFSGTLPLDEFGTFNADFTLAEEAALGYYSINVSLPKGQASNVLGALPLARGTAGGFASTYNGTFLVAEYRRPEFTVEVTPAKDEYVQGEKIQFDVQASYFFGGAVGGGTVTWSVLAQDYFFDRYTGPGYWDWNDIDYFAPSQFGGGNVVASGEGVLDAQGNLVVELPANLDEKAGSQTFSLEATVVDVNDQAVSARAQVIVHKGLFYIGLRPEEYVGNAGRPLAINIRTVNWGGDPYGGADLDVIAYQREWFNVQEVDDFGNVRWTSTFSDTAVFTTSTTTTEGGEAQISFAPPEGGQYRVVATGKDPDGHEVRSATFVWVSSGEYVSWQQQNNDRIQLVADKKTYTPGETAQVLVPSPFQGGATQASPVQALLTIERARILEHRLVTLGSNSDVIDIPITPDMAPNAFVSIVIVKGVDETNPVPSFRVGYASFEVSIEQQVLNLTITPQSASGDVSYKFGPRDSVTYTLKVTDYQGEPVQAEVSLALTDLSVLSLLDDFAPPIDRFYYGPQGLGLRTASALVLSVDRINITFAEEGKGGGGGAPADAESGFVRQRFPETVYWNATVTTDVNGEATVSAQLADNLTTWRMRAKAVTKDTLVGEGQVDIVSTKDLLIRPVTPRFFVVGDKVNLAATVVNNTSAPVDAEVALEGTGIQIDGAIEQTVNVPAGGQVRVEWPATVLDTPPISGGTGAVADLTFSVRGGGLSDASKPPAGLPPDQRIPIYKYSTPETVGTAGVLDLDQTTDAPEAVTEV
ncbi:MAG TPA: Ig-like domain-containing protein, partial [Anaerolineae bacterium]